MNWIKKHIKKFLISIGILSVAFAATTYFTPEEVPLELKLKVSKERIVNFTDKDGVISYFYATNNEVLAKTINEAIGDNAANEHKIKEKNLTENLSKRGGKHQTWDLTADTSLTSFFSNLQFVKEKATDKWVQVEKATTTREAFEIQTRVSLLEKVIKIAYADTDTFYPDPDAETNTFDGGAWRVTTTDTWANIRAGAGTNCADSALTQVVYQGSTSSSADTWLRIYRGMYLFNTGPTIPSGNTITSATISFWGDSKTDSLSWGANEGSKTVVVAATTGSNTACTNSDYENIGATSFGESVILNSFSTTAYNDITLDSNGIANIAKGSGVSKFGTRSKYDMADTNPPWVISTYTYNDVKQAEQAGTTNDPKLVVVHSAAAAATTIRNSPIIIFEDE